MTQEYAGPYIRITFDANELVQGPFTLQLPGGYTYERIYIHYIETIELSMFMPLERDDGNEYKVIPSDQFK